MGTRFVTRSVTPPMFLILYQGREFLECKSTPSVLIICTWSILVMFCYILNRNSYSMSELRNIPKSLSVILSGISVLKNSLVLVPVRNFLTSLNSTPGTIHLHPHFNSFFVHTYITSPNDSSVTPKDSSPH